MKSEKDPLVSSNNNNNEVLQDNNSVINYNGTRNTGQRPEYPEYRYVLSEDSIVDGSIILMLSISFLSSISFSVALPSLWRYVDSLGGALDDLGWAIALHSFGTIICAPLLTLWSRRRTLREVLVGSLILMAGGGVMHGMAQNIAMLLVARFVIGAGSANYVITTVYLSQVSRRTRDRALSYNGVITIVGFIVGPAFASGLATLRIYRSPFSLDSSTAPGYVISLLSVIAAVVTGFASLQLLRKRARRTHPRPESYDPNSSHPQLFNNSASYDIAGSLLNYGIASSRYYYTEQGSVDELPAMLRELWSNRNKLPLAQLVVCFFVYFTITLAFTVWETLGPALTQHELSWDVLENGLLFVGMGVASGITLIVLHWLTKVLAGRLILPAAASLMVAGAVILLVTASEWTIPLFITAIALIAIGYTGSVSMVVHVYGQVLELSTEVPAPSSAVGWLASCGSVARVLGPVCAAYLLVNTGPSPRMLMVFATAAPASVVLCTIATYRYLPP